MKKSFVLLVLFMVGNLVAQDFKTQSMFSKTYFGVLVGTNFNTLPAAGVLINFEVKSNIASNLNAKLSLGYSTLYDDNSYDLKYYRYSDFSSKYHTRLLAVDRVKYTIIPVTLGAEYFITRTKLSPFALFEFGYNFSSSVAEGITHDGISGIYDTVNEIPEEYRKTPTALDDGSSFSLGVGVGAIYKLTDRMDLNVRYIYRYNDSMVNNNQLLFGVTF